MDKQDVICVFPVEMKKRLPHSGIPEYEPGPEMVRIRCEKCKTISWIGPKQQEMKICKPECPIMCFACIFELSQKEGKSLFTEVRDLGGVGGKIKE